MNKQTKSFFIGVTLAMIGAILLDATKLVAIPLTFLGIGGYILVLTSFGSNE